MSQKSLKLILASGSKYRQEQLRTLNLDFSCVASRVNETPFDGESPGALSLRLAKQKAQSVLDKNPGSCVIGCDQSAALNGTRLHKPGSIENAQKQLHLCSGMTVTFYSAICVLTQQLEQCKNVITEVTFRPLSEAEIQRYVDQDHPIDCAGSFKAEGLGITLFKSITSEDPSAIVGLPLITAAHFLRNCGAALP